MVNDLLLSEDDQRSYTWLDAFPWLRGAAEPSALKAWAEPIEGSSVPVRAGRLSRISELAMERLTQWTIGQIFPGLPADLNILEIRLPARAVNVLHHNNCHTAADIIPVRLEEMMAWRQVGVGTIDSILQVLADASTSSETPAVTTSIVSNELDHREKTLDSADFLTRDFRIIASWYALIGLPDRTILGMPLAPGSPREVIEARQRIEKLHAGNLLEDECRSDVADLFEMALQTLDKRAAEILANRLFADSPLTLDQIGKSYGVTRERIRQIEGKARGAMLGFISEGGPLAMVANAARTLIGTIRPLDDLLAVVPSLGNTVESVNQPAWRVLDALDDAYEIDGRWCAVPTMQSAEMITRAHLEERADQYGVVRLNELDLIQTSQSEQLLELLSAWLQRCDYVVEGDAVYTRVGSVGDYGAAVLSVTGFPLAAQDIVDRFVTNRSVGSLKNAMGQDERFERVDRDRWALKEWGLESYGGIRSVIREQVARHGGRISLNTLIEQVTGQYSVTANSVTQYASIMPFETKDGIVRLHSGDHENRKNPTTTRRLFRRPAAWAHRIRINTEHLRGSGSVAPVGVAGAIGLQPGESRHLPSPLGPQLVTWTSTQPAFGTIRRFLVDQDIAAGTEAFLVLRDDGGFGFESAREATGHPLSDALRLIGAADTSDVAVACRAFAAALQMPESSPAIGLIGAYRERGDDDIAELLVDLRDQLDAVSEPEIVQHRDDVVDEILDLL